MYDSHLTENHVIIDGFGILCISVYSIQYPLNNAIFSLATATQSVGTPMTQNMKIFQLIDCPSVCISDDRKKHVFKNNTM